MKPLYVLARSTFSAALSCAVGTCAVFFATSALDAQESSGLVRVGPVDPVTHFPLWYEDANGVKLGICKSQINCLIALPNPDAPISVPGNWADEFFYYNCNGRFSSPPGSRAKVGSCQVSLEGAYVNGAVVVGEEMVFTRIRLHLTNGLQPAGQYIFQHPWGAEFLDADESGTIFFTRDVGAGAARDFGASLGGNLKSFVMPAGFNAAGAPNGSYIADINVLQSINADNALAATATMPAVPAYNGFRVIDLNNPANSLGSALNTNYPDGLGDNLRGTVTIAGVPRDYVGVLGLTMQGQIPAQFGVEIDRTDYVLRSAANGTSVLNVWAQSASGQSLVATVPGHANTPLAERGGSGHYYGRIQIPATAFTTNPTVVVTNVRDVPATQASSTFTDHLFISKAEYDIGSNRMLISVKSSDTLNSGVQLTIKPEGHPITTLAGSSFTDARATINTSFTPPQIVTVSSSRGGSETVRVELTGNAVIAAPVPVSTPIVAAAGVDQTVLFNPALTTDPSISLSNNVRLSGSASTGNGTLLYSWLELAALRTPGAPNITILSPDPIQVAAGHGAGTAYFQTPSLLGRGLGQASYTVQLTVTEQQTGISSVDTMEITVNDPRGAAALDRMTPVDFRYVAGKAYWRGNGTASILAGQKVTVYLDNPDTATNPRIVGTAIVDALGAWSFQNAQGTATVANRQIPGPTDTLVWVKSDWVGGSTPATFTFLRK